MQITPNKLNIQQLLTTSNEQFVVPPYQRRYAWKQPQYRVLYEDIEMLDSDEGHLLGMIILHSNLHVAGLNQPELVDGQQRLTTFIILLKAFETIFHGKGETRTVNEIRNLIFCNGLDGVEKPKIILGDLDQRDLEILLRDGEVKNITNQNIRDAFTDYFNWLSELKDQELRELYFKLKNNAVIIRLDVGLAKDAYKLFETINNRGLRLTPTDIIKNFLLGHAAKLQEGQILERVKELWSNILTELDGIDTNDFLRQYMSATLFRKVSMSKLIYEFKNYYLKHIKDTELLCEFKYYQDPEVTNNSDDETIDKENDNIEKTDENGCLTISIIDFLNDIHMAAKEYRKIIFSQYEDLRINKHIRNLNAILSTPANIFLVKFLPNDKYSVQEKVKVLKYIETIMLRRHVCERRTSENDNIFSKMVSFIGSDNIMGKIKQYIDDADLIPDDATFNQMLPKHKFEGKLIDRAKYILGSIEEQKCGNTQEFLIDPNVHLEHIIPQNITTQRSKEEFGDWEQYLGENSRKKHPKLVNLLGNMTLLGGSLNIKASNNPFGKKKECYKKSNFTITRELANYPYFKFKNLKKRGEELAAIALEIWKN